MREWVNSFFTARKRSLGQGNIFRSMCQEFCPRGGCVVVGAHAWLLGGCVGYDEIRSMSGRYASYWNAFLFVRYF